MEKNPQINGINKDFFKKKISVGLCLGESFQDIQSFLERNQKWLNSVYFSLPLGKRYFSRDSLEKEYTNNEKKLFDVLNLLKEMGIRRELAVNTWNLSEEEITCAIDYCRRHDLIPEEVVCLKEYGKAFRQAFPGAEIKYSVNNPEADGSGITKDFDTMVAGKGVLRNRKVRNHFIDNGWAVTLLLNNGCIPICNTICETIQCHRYYDHAINKDGLDETYALCSFFPSELKALLMNDRFADQYKFKISNRPLGYSYTQQVLDAYLSLVDDYEVMESDHRKLTLFCTAHPLAIRIHDIHLDHVRQLKDKLIESAINDYRR